MQSAEPTRAVLPDPASKPRDVWDEAAAEWRSKNPAAEVAPKNQQQPRNIFDDLPGWTYRDPINGYSLWLPQGWVQVPDEAVRGSNLWSWGDGVTIRAVFQDKNQPWMNHPYIVIYTAPYLGGRQPTLWEISQMIKTADLHSSNHETVWDARKHTDYVTLRDDSSFRAPETIFASTHYGRNGTVSVAWYTTPARSDAEKNRYLCINDALKFDPDAAYDESLNAPPAK